jgi:hypothetical protein
MSSGSLEERLYRVERLLAGEVEVVDVVTGTMRFFAGDLHVRECRQWYAEACAEGHPFVDRDDRPDDTGSVKTAGSLSVGTYVTFYDAHGEPPAWWCYRITATARVMEAE